MWQGLTEGVRKLGAEEAFWAQEGGGESGNVKTALRGAS